MMMNRMAKLFGAVFSTAALAMANVYNPTYKEVGKLNYLPETIETACTPVLDSRNTTKAKALRKKRGF